MRRFSFQTLFLTLSILISIFLSYLLIFDNNIILSRWTSNQETAQINIQNDNLTVPSEYYQLANVKMSEIIYPTKVVISQNEQAYLLNNYDVLRDIVKNLTQRRITVTGAIEIPTDEEYLEIITQERVELEFTNVFPFQVSEHLIKNESNETAFTYNRIIFPLKQDVNEAYLVNTLERAYMKAKMPEGSTSQDYLDLATSVRSGWLVATRFDLNNLNHVYLPNDTIQVLSQLYTIEKVPETILISSVFGNARVWQNATTNEDVSRGVLSYYNSNIDLKMNVLSQMLGISYRNTSQLEAKTYAERIIQSYNQVRLYEYWKEGLRYSSISTATNAVFQRYLNGFPVFSTSNINHYASSRVLFKGGNLNASITTLSMPMLYLESHISDYTQPYELMNSNQLIMELGQAGFDITDFSNVLIGYEWQEDMANFQKVNFVPKWFFERNGVFYTLEQIKAGALTSTMQVEPAEITEGGE